jgi:putative Mg2+ transporter-C (MgtC) family protein
MMISDSFYLQSLTGGSGNWHPDPARLAAGALSGMGFLGAGVIIRQSSHLIRGVTTAATLWFSTVLGLAFGSGAIGIGILGTLIAFIILYLIPSLEAHIQDDWYSDLSVRLDSHASSLESLLNELKSFPIRIKSLDIQTSKLTDEQQVVFHLKYKKVDLINFPIEVTMRIGSLPGVRETHWHA